MPSTTRSISADKIDLAELRLGGSLPPTRFPPRTSEIEWIGLALAVLD